MTPEAPYTYQIRNIDAKLWHQVKVYAATHQITIKDLILGLLKAKVDNAAERKG